MTQVTSDKFAPYTPLLLTLEQQLEQLRRYNSQYWENRLSEEQLAAVVITSDHDQRVDDLEVFHVEFDSLEETVEMWWKVFVGEQPGHWRWEQLRLDPDHLRLRSSNVRTYQPGIHRIRINLVAHWDPKSGRSLERVYAEVADTDETLAQAEVLSTYGLHTELFREQDGVNLPYSDMAGIEVSVSGDPDLPALCVRCAPITGKAELDAVWVDYHGYGWAAPVVREL